EPIFRSLNLRGHLKLRELGGKILGENQRRGSGKQERGEENLGLHVLNLRRCCGRCVRTAFGRCQRIVSTWPVQSVTRNGDWKRLEAAWIRIWTSGRMPLPH